MVGCVTTTWLVVSASCSSGGQPLFIADASSLSEMHIIVFQWLAVGLWCTSLVTSQPRNEQTSAQDCFVCLHDLGIIAIFHGQAFFVSSAQ